MTDDITLITIYKNHDRRFIESFVKSSSEQVCKIILVDYSKNKNVARYINWLCKTYENLCPITVKNRTREFSIAHANNIGIKHAKTKYVAFSGIDHVFPDGLFKDVKKLLEQDVIVLAWADLLDKNGNITGCSSKAASGHLMCMEREKVVNIHGFDEEFKTWGGEDNDLLYRMYSLGIKSAHVSKTIIHQWHCKADQPIGLDKIIAYEKIPNKPVTRNPNGWGEL